MLTKENYFEKGMGSPSTAMLSSSVLKYLYPGQGGSYGLFKHHLANYDAEREKLKHKTSIRFGKVFHSYLEDMGSFKVADFDRPSNVIVDIVDHVYQLNNNTVLKDAEDEILKAIEIYPYGPKNWKESTVIARIVAAGNEYYEHLKESDGKVVITSKEKETLENVIESWLSSPLYTDFSQRRFQKEYPLEWGYPSSMGVVPCKSLIDNLDMEKREFIDFKTNGSILPYTAYRDNRIDRQTGFLSNAYLPGPGITYRVYRQMAFYRFGLAVKSEETYAHSIIVFQTVPPYSVERYVFNDSALAAGEDEIEQAVNEYIKGLSKDMDYGGM